VTPEASKPSPSFMREFRGGPRLKTNRSKKNFAPQKEYLLRALL